MFIVEYYITSISKTTINLKQSTTHIAKKNPREVTFILYLLLIFIILSILYITAINL